MATSGQSWKEHNRKHKEQRKKWREERLIKKTKHEESVETPKVPEKTESKKIHISTVSIAVPGSILDNAQSPMLKTNLAGRIARAACIYKVDEIIVYDDQGEVTETEKKKLKKHEQLGVGRGSCIQLGRLLQYLECPQYLRRFFFPSHEDLEHVGLLSPLDAPHHFRKNDFTIFREGIVTNKPLKPGKGSQVNVGLENDVHIDKVLTPGLRVTIKLLDQENLKKLKGIVVSPKVPRAETGIYWGYSVRLASNLTEVFVKCPYSQGYDLTIGTSDKGTSIDDIPKQSLEYNHALIVFGGLAGIEAALDVDPQLDADDPALIFDKYLNTCPEQGSRTIRTEEAILITMSELRGKLKALNPPKQHVQFENRKITVENHSPVKKSSDLDSSD